MSIDKSLLAYCVVIMLGIVMLWRWNTSERFKEFYLLDLIAEHGKLSSRKFIEFSTWVVMTVAFIMLVERDKLTEWYVLAYGGLGVGARTLGQLIHSKSEKKEGS